MYLGSSGCGVGASGHQLALTTWNLYDLSPLWSSVDVVHFMRRSIQFCNSWFRDVPAVPAVPAVQQELVGPVGALGPQGVLETLGALGLLQLPGLSALV